MVIVWVCIITIYDSNWVLMYYYHNVPWLWTIKYLVLISIYLFFSYPHISFKVPIPLSFFLPSPSPNFIYTVWIIPITKRVGPDWIHIYKLTMCVRILQGIYSQYTGAMIDTEYNFTGFYLFNRSAFKGMQNQNGQAACNLILDQLSSAHSGSYPIDCLLCNSN